jgi:hypothetical protein
LAGARNTGINAAKGEYIALLDSDDIFLPNKLEEQINALERHPECGVCYCDLVHFTDTKPREFFHHEYNTLSGDIFRALLRKQFINPLAIVAKKEVFENYGMFNESLRRSEDWDLWLRWARQGVTFYHLTAVLAQYRMRTEGNLSSLDSEPQMKQKNLEIFEALAQAMSPEEREIYSLSAIVATMRRKVALAYLLIGDKKMALAVPGLSIANRFAIKMIPGKAFEYSGRSLRRWKHRLLLKKV